MADPLPASGVYEVQVIVDGVPVAYQAYLVAPSDASQFDAVAVAQHFAGGWSVIVAVYLMALGAGAVIRMFR